MATNEWNAALYDQKHSYVPEFGKSLISVLDPQAGEFILDLGCGTGHLTKAIAESGAHVIGIDSSPEMIERARATYPDLEFYVSDARDFSFPMPFDAIFSNSALHWIPEAEEVVRCMVKSLKPGGRIAVEFGGKGDAITLRNAIRRAIGEFVPMEGDSGWYFPSISEYTSLLEHNGLTVQLAWLFERPTKLEGGESGLRGWLEMFVGSLLHTVPDEMRPQIIEKIEIEARDRLFKDGHWFADYKRLRIVAHKL